MGYEIRKYGSLDEEQKKQAVELFMEGFGKMMTFAKDEGLKKKLLFDIFDPSLFLCYTAEGKVLGLLGLADSKARPLNFAPEACKKHFGNFRGGIISKQMNAVFQKPVVKAADELYIDILVTGSAARRKGVGTALLQYAFGLEGYKSCLVHVFSNNRAAISLYEKNGFAVEKREKWSLMRFLGAGSGYPVRMRRTVG